MFAAYPFVCPSQGILGAVKTVLWTGAQSGPQTPTLLYSLVFVTLTDQACIVQLTLMCLCEHLAGFRPRR